MEPNGTNGGVLHDLSGSGGSIHINTCDRPLNPHSAEWSRVTGASTAANHGPVGEQTTTGAPDGEPPASSRPGPLTSRRNEQAATKNKTRL